MSSSLEAAKSSSGPIYFGPFQVTSQVRADEMNPLTVDSPHYFTTNLHKQTHN